ncbi:MAG TPA: SCO2525 family SAM-dependent methyltransferase [Micromonosporaceae bacterium]|nr:SCO2525 family SAM-dependent methyltransferase [Micromonosporaceae bacterium]
MRETVVPSAATHTGPPARNPPPRTPPARNQDFPWDTFDSQAYYTHNYWSMHDADRKIIAVIRDFFAGADIDPATRGVDVGAGTNLYPAMAMLPFCSHVDLIEFSASNVDWLEKQVPGYGGSWDDFWKLFTEHDAYERIADPRTQFARKVSVQRGSVFALPRRHWGLGTMFFVACSLSEKMTEFHAAVEDFAGALAIGAPFAAAFMENSQGYPVGDRKFPAVDIDVDTVRDCLASVAYNVDISRIDIGEKLRDGYGGMIVATGRVAEKA